MNQNLFLLAIVLAGAAAYMGSRVVTAPAGARSDAPGTKNPLSGIAVITGFGMLIWSIGAFGWQWAAIGMIAFVAGGMILGAVVAANLGARIGYASLVANGLFALGLIVGFGAVVKTMQPPPVSPPCVQPTVTPSVAPAP
jgi:hypothetical protein